jgi:hypothetical protein
MVLGEMELRVLKANLLEHIWEEAPESTYHVRLEVGVEIVVA